MSEKLEQPYKSTLNQINWVAVSVVHTMDIRSAEEVERKQCCYSTPFSMEVIRKQLNIIDLHTIEYWYWSSAYEITYEIYIQLTMVWIANWNSY